MKKVRAKRHQGSGAQTKTVMPLKVFLDRVVEWHEEPDIKLRGRVHQRCFFSGVFVESSTILRRRRVDSTQIIK